MSALFRYVGSLLQQRPYTALMTLSYLCWIFFSWDFISVQFNFADDAISYFDHVNFYTESLLRGVYPLWFPDWSNGAPYLFFLRRMGDVNPFYLVMVVFNFLNISHELGYRLFLVLYFFFAAFGFYQLTYALFKNRLTAYISFNLLLFSSFSFLLFNNYIVLLLTPYIWFVYCLVLVCRKASVLNVLALVFWLMIINATYIPFLFYLIILFITVGSVITFPRQCVEAVKSIISFIRSHMVFSIVCIALIGASFIPGIDLYLQSKSADSFAMPSRNIGSEGSSVLAASTSLIKGGDLITHGHFEYLLGDMEGRGYGDCYVALWAFVIFLFSFFGKLSRLQILILSISSFSILFAMTTATPIYGLFEKSLFFTKYIRQVYYFFWLFAFPCLLMVIAQQAVVMLDMLKTTPLRQRWLMVLLGIHVLVGVLLVLTGGGDWSQYALLGGSLLYLGCVLYKKLDVQSLGSALIIFFLIAAPALRVFHLVFEQMPQHTKSTYAYPEWLREFKYSKKSTKANKLEVTQEQIIETNRRRGGHYTSASFAALKKVVNSASLDNYLQHKFILYDRIQYIDIDAVNYTQLGLALFESVNLAFIDDADRHGQVTLLNNNVAENYDPVIGAQGIVDVIDYSLNHMKVHVTLDRPRLLVYNDSFDQKWRVKVDGKPQELLRANVAFKGVLVPAGEYEVEFIYASALEYGVRILSVFIVWMIGGILLFMFWRRDNKQVSV